MTTIGRRTRWLITNWETLSSIRLINHNLITLWTNSNYFDYALLVILSLDKLEHHLVVLHYVHDCIACVLPQWSQSVRF